MSFLILDQSPKVGSPSAPRFKGMGKTSFHLLTAKSLQLLSLLALGTLAIIQDGIAFFAALVLPIVLLPFGKFRFRNEGDEVGVFRDLCQRLRRVIPFVGRNILDTSRCTDVIQVNLSRVQAVFRVALSEAIAD